MGIGMILQMRPWKQFWDGLQHVRNDNPSMHKGPERRASKAYKFCSPSPVMVTSSGGIQISQAGRKTTDYLQINQINLYYMY
jgi:hypothetical protein